MAVECGVITLLLVFIIGAFLRSKRRTWAFATLPLLLVPATHAVSIFIMGPVLKLKISLAMASIPIIIALVVSCTWIGFISATVLQRRKTRLTYLASAIAFEVALSLILISSYYFAQSAA